MSKKSLAIALIIIGALAGSLAAVAIWLGNRGGVFWLLFGIGLTSGVLGPIIGLTALLDRKVKPIVSELKDGLEDDLEDLNKGKVNWPIWQGGLTVVAIIIFMI